MLLAVLFVPIALAVAALAFFGPLHAAMGRLQLAWGVGSGAWVVAVLVARRVDPARAGVVLVVVGAVALRLLALAGDAELSDDRYRYAFEGGLVAEGKSPYAFEPLAPERAGERARWGAVLARMNNPEISAAYPPLTQAFLAGVVVLSGGVEAGVFGMRVAFALCDLAVLLPLFALLRRRRLPLALAVAWAWSPLVALEFAGSGHFDSLGILLLVGALALFERGGEPGGGTSAQLGAAAGLAGGIAVKLLPVLALPFALRAARRPISFALAAAAALLLAWAWVPLLEGGARGLSSGLLEYGLRWESTSLVFRFVEPWFASHFAFDGGWSDPRVLARALVAAILAGVGVLQWARRSDPVRSTAVLIAAFLVLTPTLHPWYLTWLVAFLALWPSAAFTWLCASAPLFYWPLEGWRSVGAWTEPPWLWPVVALPFLALLALELVGAWRPGKHP